MLKQLQFFRDTLMRSYISVWLTLVLGSLISGSVAIFVATQEMRSLQQQFPRRVNHLALALQQRIEGSLQGTLTLGRFCAEQVSN